MRHCLEGWEGTTSDRAHTFHSTVDIRAYGGKLNLPGKRRQKANRKRSPDWQVFTAALGAGFRNGSRSDKVPE